MHFNYYFLKSLSKSLQENLIGKTLATCFSQNKDELVLIFENEDTQFIIKATFDNVISFLTFPKDFNRARKNSVDLFDEIKGHSVKKIIQYENERSISLTFDNNFKLLLKLHGRRANICLFENEQFHSMFKNSFVNDRDIILDKVHRTIDQSKEACLSSKFNLKTLFPTFDNYCYAYLSEHDFVERNDSDKLKLLEQLLDQLNSGHYVILEKEDGHPYLSLLNEPDLNFEFRSPDPIEACNLLASQYFHSYLLKKEKSQLIFNIDKDIDKGNSYIEKSKHKLQLIINGIKHSEIANILMANLHVKQNHSDKIELFDFYRNQNITIKIKPRLTLQANAEIFYRKAKNHQIEIDQLSDNIKRKEFDLNKLIHQKNVIVKSQSLKDLRKAHNTKTVPIKKKSTQVSVPYIEYIIDGYKILVGKNAKSNDQLLKQFTTKDDLWLHARNVSGSHVIIKNPNENISKHTIEKVAQIAAWYSKGKNDTLCPVIFTKRKYVNKPKGAEVGKVVVQREEVILVNPCQNPQSQ